MTNGALGTLDPTLLPDGAYTLTLIDDAVSAAKRELAAQWRHLSHRWGEPGPPTERLWEHVKVAYIDIAPRDIPDPAVLKQAGWPDEEIGLAVKRSDKIDSCRSFLVGFEVDWDVEHGVHTARSRDDKFVEMGFEGQG